MGLQIFFNRQVNHCFNQTLATRLGNFCQSFPHHRLVFISLHLTQHQPRPKRVHFFRIGFGDERRSPFRIRERVDDALMTFESHDAVPARQPNKQKAGHLKTETQINWTRLYLRPHPCARIHLQTNPLHHFIDCAVVFGVNKQRRERGGYAVFKRQIGKLIDTRNG